MKKNQKNSLPSHSEEKRLFQKFLTEKKLKHSSKRDVITDVFWTIHEHVTAEELYLFVKKKDKTIGFTTVYRTLKLLCESGLCSEMKFQDGAARYEHLYNHRHHDHLFCVKCGACIEFCAENIEKEQDIIFQKHKFLPSYHKMELYGVCPSCQNNP